MDYAVSPFAPVVEAWRGLIANALKVKNDRFQLDATESMKFFSGPYDFWFKQLAKDRFFRVPGETMEQDDVAVMTVNKVAEAVQIFGPTLYHKNPDRLATPRQFPVVPDGFYGDVMHDRNAAMQYQQDQAVLGQAAMADGFRAMLFQSLLNWTPHANGLMEEARQWVDEAIIKGLSCIWTETTTPPGSKTKTTRSFWDSVDNLVIDPEVGTIKAGKWIARLCLAPAWEVEREFNLPPDYLKSCAATTTGMAASYLGDHPVWVRARLAGRTLVAYWKVYSKMGAGGRDPMPVNGISPQTAAYLNLLGDYCYLAICPGVPHPLNLPPWRTDGAQGYEFAQQAVQWPTPHWADRAWPMTPLYFHARPNDPWPMSHFAPAMGELKFLNWGYTKIAGKIKTTCRDLIAVRKDVEDALREAIKSGVDLEVVPFNVSGNDTLKELIQFIQHPTWNQDIWAVIEKIEQNFEKRVGLTELMYGQTSTQIRSASESQSRMGQIAIRPEDMANKVEEAASALARREMVEMAWHLTPEDVAPVLGPVAARWWAVLVYNAYPGDVFNNVEVRVEAGSAKKPNRDTEAANMNQALQTLFQPLLMFAQATGQVNPVNNLILAWGQAMGIANPQRFTLQPVMPPAPQPAKPPAKPAAA